MMDIFYNYAKKNFPPEIGWELSVFENEKSRCFSVSVRKVSYFNRRIIEVINIYDVN